MFQFCLGSWLGTIVTSLPSCCYMTHNRRQNCWDTILKWVISQDKTICASPVSPSQRWSVCYRYRAQRRNIARRGWGRESFFFPFWSRQNVTKALILSLIEVMIGLVLFLARDFSNNHKPRRCKKQNKINKTNKATTKLLLKLIWKLLLININTHKQCT